MPAFIATFLVAGLRAVVYSVAALMLLQPMYGGDEQACLGNEQAAAETGANRPSGAAEHDAVMSDGPVEVGKYIVHHVAMCIYCHTPRDETGNLQADQLLQGAVMPVSSPFEGQQWAYRAPRLAGLPAGWAEEELARFLETGKPPSKHDPAPPMPPFRMTPQDARAVAAYLKSLR